MKLNMKQRIKLPGVLCLTLLAAATLRADPLAYFAAVVRGEVKVADRDLSALANNVIVMRILEAARQSAATGKTVKLATRTRLEYRSDIRSK